MSTLSKALNKTLLRKVIELAIGLAADSVEEVIADIADDPTIVSSRQKRQKAEAMIKDELKRAGKSAKSHLVNLAIEAAVASLRK